MNELRQAAPQPCIGADPMCPCQDGDACHYKDGPDGTKALAQEPQPEPVAVVPREFRAALRKLVFMARTSGGTAGPDSGLMAALDEAERVLALPYLNAPPRQPVPRPLTERQIKDMQQGPGYDVLSGMQIDIVRFTRAVEAAVIAKMNGGA